MGRRCGHVGGVVHLLVVVARRSGSLVVCAAAFGGHSRQTWVVSCEE